MNTDIKIAVIGLGYVGLPLARLFATQYSVVGFDINQTRIEALKKGNDSTLEIDSATLRGVLVDTPRGCRWIVLYFDTIRNSRLYLLYRNCSHSRG